MSIEAAMEALTKALEKNTAALMGGKAAPAAETKATETKAADKPAKAPAKAPKITQDALAAKANELKEKSGMPAVREIFKAHGSKTGKMGEVPEANYAAVIAAIDEALADEPAAEAEEDEGL